MLQYLRTNTADKRVKLGLSAAMGLTVISILASYSRGALLGLGITLGFLFLKARRRVATALIIGSVLLAGLFMLPEGWFDRMQSIQDFEQDQSAIGRFDAWTFAYKLALDHPFFGGGQLVGNDVVLFKHYVPTAINARAAHSIYFEVLGETGFVGLGIFLILIYVSFRAASEIIRSTRDRPELQWARSLAAMLQVSFVGYATTGAFLSLGFFDLYYALVAIVAVTQLVVRRELGKLVATPIGDPVSAEERFKAVSGLSNTRTPDPRRPELAPS
jgi:probable O-glycosylation ligase (exosortase A-associated)